MWHSIRKITSVYPKSEKIKSWNRTCSIHQWKSWIQLVFLRKDELDRTRRSRDMGENVTVESEHGFSNLPVMRSCGSVQKVFWKIPKWWFFAVLLPQNFGSALAAEFFQNLASFCRSFLARQVPRSFPRLPDFLDLPLPNLFRHFSAVMHTNQADHHLHCLNLTC